MATLKEYAAKDFVRYTTSDREHTGKLQESGQELKWQVRVHQDYESCTEFISIYIPELTSYLAASIAACTLREVPRIISDAHNVDVIWGHKDLGMYSRSEDLKFTGRLFVYYEGLAGADAVQSIVSSGR